MITPEFGRKMAAYNAWQNNGLISIVHAMDEEDLRADRQPEFTQDRKSTRLNSSHSGESRMPSSA